ncbi:MAG: excinuclease ATPase subunit [Porticoccus sp.]|nr:excinuclease ATPase subunit [Porticoccus sp.]MBQ0807578.1 excinuclease ATPase subunit [Porticoccus sp.]
MTQKITLILLLLIASLPAQARDTKHLFSIQDALISAAFNGRLDSNIKLYFGDTSDGKITKQLGDFTSNRKTNAAGKSDHKSCDWALLSALLTLQKRAVTEGGNAVINIRSFYKKNELSSTTKYECHAGAIMAGVALKGTVVRIE